jgi:putative transposase
VLDRIVLALTTLFASPSRIAKLCAVIKPSMLLKFHRMLVDKKYRQLFFSPSHRRKPGPKGPSAELIAAIVEMKQRNPQFGCVRIAQQISYAFGLQIVKSRATLTPPQKPPNALVASQNIEIRGIAFRVQR